MDISKVTSSTLVQASNTKKPGVASVSTDAAATLQPFGADANASTRAVIESAVVDMHSQLQNVQRNLSFTVDDATGDVVVKVIDGESGKVVREIPSKEVLELAARLEDMRSLMFEAKA